MTYTFDQMHEAGRRSLTASARFADHVVLSLADWKAVNVPYFPKDSEGRYLATGDPTIHEPIEDPDDDIDAEVPDVREDPVPE